MNITLMIGGLSGGGAERVMCNLGNFLSKNHNVTILTMSDDEPAYNLNEEVNRISLYNEREANNQLVKNIKRLNRMRKIINNNKTDIYVVMLPITTMLLLLFRKYIDVPVIIAERGDPEITYNKSKMHKIIMDKFYPKADNFVFQTKDVKKFYKYIFKVNGTVIPNAINEEFIISPYLDERRKAIVSVGRFTEQKNFELLIKAFHKIHHKFPDYYLEIYGDGPLRNDLEQLLEDLNLTERVTFPGYVNDIGNYIKDASLFVLSSNFEGMPNALMEAMALGIPSISTDCPVGGPNYLINNGINGYLTPVNDIESLAHKMSYVLSDSQKANKFSVESRKIISELHPNKIYKLWENLIIKTVENY